MMLCEQSATFEVVDVVCNNVYLWRIIPREQNWEESWVCNSE